MEYKREAILEGLCRLAGKSVPPVRCLQKLDPEGFDFVRTRTEVRFEGRRLFLRNVVEHLMRVDYVVDYTGLNWPDHAGQVFCTTQPQKLGMDVMAMPAV